MAVHFSSPCRRSVRRVALRHQRRRRRRRGRSFSRRSHRRCLQAWYSVPCPLFIMHVAWAAQPPSSSLEIEGHFFRSLSSRLFRIPCSLGNRRSRPRAQRKPHLDHSPHPALQLRRGSVALVRHGVQSMARFLCPSRPTSHRCGSPAQEARRCLPGGTTPCTYQQERHQCRQRRQRRRQRRQRRQLRRLLQRFLSRKL